MSSLHRIAPIFAVRDLELAMDHYRRLGFEVRAYEGGYGLATREDVEIHLGVVDDHDGPGWQRHPLWLTHETPAAYREGAPYRLTVANQTSEV